MHSKNVMWTHGLNVEQKADVKKFKNLTCFHPFLKKIILSRAFINFKTKSSMCIDS